VPSNDPDFDPFEPAGSTVGIVADPLGNPHVIAATRPVPLGFFDNLALSADGQYRFAFHRLLADFNGDAVVDLLDKPLLLDRYLAGTGDDRYRFAFDLDANHRIDRFDYAAWRRRIGASV